MIISDVQSRERGSFCNNTSGFIIISFCTKQWADLCSAKFISKAGNVFFAIANLDNSLNRHFNWMNLQSFLMMLSRNCSLPNRPNSTYESIYRSIWNYTAILFDDQPKMFLQMKSNIDSDVRTKTLCIQFFFYSSFFGTKRT